MLNVKIVLMVDVQSRGKAPCFLGVWGWGEISKNGKYLVLSILQNI